MRIALLADLHGNWPATKALENDLRVQNADQIICLGDVVGKGPSSPETLDWARENCHLILGGNWDYGVGYRRFPGDQYYWDQLGEERLTFLRDLPKEHVLTLSGRRIRLFHGRPLMEELVTIRNDAEEIQPFFEDEAGVRFDVVGYGDAHRQALRTLTPGIFFNCGSVGNALGELRCCYALLEGNPEDPLAPFEIRFRSLTYDREEAIRQAKTALHHIPRIDCYIKELETGRYSR